MRLLLPILLFALSLASNAVDKNQKQVVHYPNLEKEARLIESIEDNIMTGDTVYLHDGKSEFLVIFTESEVPTKETIILIHGMGSNANTTQVIYPLRVHLSKNFNTLSIQMPVLRAGMVSDDYRPIIFPITANRIKASIDYIDNNDLTLDFIIGHSIGSAMTAHYLAKTLSDIRGFIAIGMPQCVTEFLPKIDIPILDLFGTNDIDSVISGITPKKHASTHNLNYIQLQVPANHNFDNEEAVLINSVSAWIKSH
jgi:predicted esterase